MKILITVAASLALIACNGGSDAIPDGRVTVDGSAKHDGATTLDSSSGDPVTVTVNLFGSGSANANIDVHFVPPSGPAIDKLTDTNGVASAIVPAGASFTIGAKVSAADGGTYEFISVVGANPGDNFVIGAPATALAPITSFTVDISPLDQTSAMEVRTPCSAPTQVSPGATSVVITGTACATTPFDILALIRDSDTQEVSKWTLLSNQTPAEGMTYTLPTTWNDPSTFTATVMNVPSIYSSDVALHLNQFSQDVDINDEDAGGVGVDDSNSATNTIAYAPVGEQMVKISLNSSDSKHKYDVQYDSVSTTETFDMGANAFPQIDSPVLDPVSRALTWTEEPVVGTPATISGRVIIASYQVTDAGSTANIEWAVITPPGSPSVSWPTAADTFSAVDISHSSQASIFVRDVAMHASVTYSGLVQFFTSGIANSYTPIPGGFWVVSGGSN